LACLEGRERFRGEASFRGYLFAIAYKVLCKHYRERRRGPEALDFEVECAHTLSSPTQALAARQEQRLLLLALRRLPVDHQVALELHYWEGLTAAEIGVVLDLPLGTAKTRIRRGRALLELQLQSIAESPELLHSTLANLEGWARQLRARVLGEADGG
jgi:RNA polymerase sigma-70 factor (ECF subfamily)